MSLTAASGLLANDVAVTDTVTFVSSTTPSHGAVTVNNDGTFTYTPAADYTGPDSFTYTIKNSTDPSLTGTGTVSTSQS